MNQSFSRPRKLNHADTIRYEIYMLRHSILKMKDGNLGDFDVWTYLEDFLLHFRNLIEFLGNERRRAGDLHITNIWGLMNLRAPANLIDLYEKGKKLWAKYEPTNAQGGSRISQYLQHCTEKRIDAKDWEVGTMSNEIEPLLIDVEAGLGQDTGILKPVPAIGHLTLRAFGSPVSFQFIEDDGQK